MGRSRKGSERSRTSNGKGKDRQWEGQSKGDGQDLRPDVDVHGRYESDAAPRNVAAVQCNLRQRDVRRLTKEMRCRWVSKG